MTKLENSNSDKTQVVTKLKKNQNLTKLKNSNCDSSNSDSSESSSSKQVDTSTTDEMFSRQLLAILAMFYEGIPLRRSEGISQVDQIHGYHRDQWRHLEAMEGRQRSKVILWKFQD